MSLDSAAERDPRTKLPPRLKLPKADWFDPNKPATADPEDDWLIEIYEGRFVGLRMPGEREPLIFQAVQVENGRFAHVQDYRTKARALRPRRR